MARRKRSRSSESSQISQGVYRGREKSSVSRQRKGGLHPLEQVRRRAGLHVSGCRSPSSQRVWSVKDYRKRRRHEQMKRSSREQQSVSPFRHSSGESAAYHARSPVNRLSDRIRRVERAGSSQNDVPEHRYGHTRSRSRDYERSRSPHRHDTNAKRRVEYDDYRGGVPCDTKKTRHHIATANIGSRASYKRINVLPRSRRTASPPLMGLKEHINWHHSSTLDVKATTKRNKHFQFDETKEDHKNWKHSVLPGEAVTSEQKLLFPNKDTAGRDRQNGGISSVDTNTFKLRKRSLSAERKLHIDRSKEARLTTIRAEPPSCIEGEEGRPRGAHAKPPPTETHTAQLRLQQLYSSADNGNTGASFSRRESALPSCTHERALPRRREKRQLQPQQVAEAVTSPSVEDAAAKIDDFAWRKEGDRLQHGRSEERRSIETPGAFKQAVLERPANVQSKALRDVYGSGYPKVASQSQQQSMQQVASSKERAPARETIEEKTEAQTVHMTKEVQRGIGDGTLATVEGVLQKDSHGIEEKKTVTESACFVTVREMICESRECRSKRTPVIQGENFTKVEVEKTDDALTSEKQPLLRVCPNAEQKYKSSVELPAFYYSPSYKDEGLRKGREKLSCGRGSVKPLKKERTHQGADVLSARPDGAVRPRLVQQSPNFLLQSTRSLRRNTSASARCAELQNNGNTWTSISPPRFLPRLPLNAPPCQTLPIFPPPYFFGPPPLQYSLNFSKTISLRPPYFPNFLPVPPCHVHPIVKMGRGNTTPAKSKGVVTNDKHRKGGARWSHDLFEQVAREPEKTRRRFNLYSEKLEIAE